MARPKGSKNKNKQSDSEVLNLQSTEVKEEDLRASTINPIIGNDIMTPSHTIVKDEEKPGSYIFSVNSPIDDEESMDDSTTLPNRGFSIQEYPELEVVDETPKESVRSNINNVFNRDSSVGKNPATIDGGEFYNFFD